MLDVAFSQVSFMDFQVTLGQLINIISCHALDSSRTPIDESICVDLLDVHKIGEDVRSLFSYLLSFHFFRWSNVLVNLQFKMD